MSLNLCILVSQLELTIIIMRRRRNFRGKFQFMKFTSSLKVNNIYIENVWNQTRLKFNETDPLEHFQAEIL